MKKAGFFILLVFMFMKAYPQNVTNANFDSVYIGGIDRIFSWITSDAFPSQNFDTIGPMTPNYHFLAQGLQYHETYATVNLDYSTAFNGPYAIILNGIANLVNTGGVPFAGFVVNGDHFYTDGTGYIDFKKGGEPFPYRPVNLKGHFKFTTQSPGLNMYGEAFVLLKKYNTSTNQSDTIGYAKTTTQLYTTSSWEPFLLPINYTSNLVPDTIVVAFLCPSGSFSSSLWIDSIGFDFAGSSAINENSIPHSARDLFTYSSNNRKLSFISNPQLISVQCYNSLGQLVLKQSRETSFPDVYLPAGNLFLLTFEFKDHSVQTFKLVTAN